MKEEMTNNSEHRILRSLNPVNRRGSQGSVSVKENEPPQRKRLSRSSGDVENNSVVPTSSVNGRRSDPPKPAPGISRTTKPAVPAQRVVARAKTSRDPVQGVKERDSKKRMWTR